MTRPMMLALALLAFGCEEKKDPAPAPAPAPAVTAPAPAANAPAPPANAAEGMKALGNALGAAAAAEGANPCEKAYNAMDAMVKAMQKQLGPGKGKDLPPKEKFVAACKELPEQIQNCMDMGYGMTHSKECQEAQAKLDPAVAAKVKGLMAK